MWAAWALLVVCVVAWPVSCQTFAKDEPPSVLSLSWFAIVLECVNIISTQDVRKQQDGEGAEGE